MWLNPKFSKSKSSRGFTLVEVFIAVVILALVIGAAASAEKANIKNTTTNQRQLEALGLAQQGLNLSKLINDQDKLNKLNVLNDHPGDPLPDAVFPTPGHYWLNTTGPNLTPTSSGCQQIPLGSRVYCREIIIEKVGTSDKKLKVKVSWTDPTGQHEVNLFSYLF